MGTGAAIESTGRSGGPPERVTAVSMKATSTSGRPFEQRIASTPFGSGDGELVGEGKEPHADREEEGAEGILLALIGPAEGVDGVELDAYAVEIVDDLLEGRDPDGSDVGAADGASLADDAQFLGALRTSQSAPDLKTHGALLG